MRTVFASVVLMAVSVAGLNPSTLSTFIRLECVQNLDAVRTELPAIFANGSLKYSLHEWYALGEAEFLARARAPANEAHNTILRTPPLNELLLANMAKFQGLSSEDVTTELLKKYYKSLKHKSILIAIDSEEDDEDDD